MLTLFLGFHALECFLGTRGFGPPCVGVSSWDVTSVTVSSGVGVAWTCTLGVSGVGVGSGVVHPHILNLMMNSSWFLFGREPSFMKPALSVWVCVGHL